MLEVLAAIATLSLVVVALGSASLVQRPGAVAASTSALPALVARARALAESTGDGATLELAPDASGFTATLYPHRPIPASDFNAATIAQVDRFSAFLASPAGGSALAIFIASSGGASWAGWTPASGALAREPDCSGSLQLVVGSSAWAVASAPLAKPSPAPAGLQWFTLSCQDATLVQS